MMGIIVSETRRAENKFPIKAILLHLVGFYSTHFTTMHGQTHIMLDISWIGSYKFKHIREVDLGNITKFKCENVNKIAVQRVNRLLKFTCSQVSD